MTADPNVLYSTVITSTAAIIAIVGGLMTAGLLQLAAERSALESSIEAATAEQQHEQQECKRIEEQIDQERASYLLLERIEEVLQLVPGHSAAEARRQLAAGYIPLVAFERAWQKLTRSVTELQPAIERVLAGSSSNAEPFHEWVSRTGIELRSGDDWLAQQIYEKCAGLKQDPHAQDELSDRGRQRMRDLEAELSDFRRSVSNSRNEIGMLHRRRALIRYPGYLVLGLVILGVFGVLGIVVPLLFMPQDQAVFTRVHRIVTVGGFLGGLVLVFGYMALLLWRLPRGA